MTTNFATALRAEIAQLEAELRADPRLRKLEHLRGLLALYVPNGAGQQVPDLVATNGAAVEAIVETKTAATKQDRIREELRLFCMAHGKVSRAKFLQYLIDNKIMGHEKNPMGNLAAYFTHWKDEFTSDGAGNWSLRESAPAQH